MPDAVAVAIGAGASPVAVEVIPVTVGAGTVGVGTVGVGTIASTVCSGAMISTWQLAGATPVEPEADSVAVCAVSGAFQIRVTDSPPTNVNASVAPPVPGS